MRFLNVILLLSGLLTACSQSGNVKKNSLVKEKIKTSKIILHPPIIEEKGKELSLQELYTMNRQAVFIIYTSDGEKYHQGSGFFISPDGTGVSNYHVFEGTFRGKELIKLLDGREYQISEVLASSKEFDYIIFKVVNNNKEVFSFTSIANSPVSVGESVFAIGNPKGLESTLSTGIISSIRTNEHLIQTTAEITNGSSGGPLFNMNGQVIGITSSGMGEANLNFAVDIRALDFKLP